MAGSRRPAALKHGLTSRSAREDWSTDVTRLAEALLGAAPREPQVLEAAREGAEAILNLRRVQQCRLLVIEDGTLRRCAPTDAERPLALKLSGAVKRGDVAECDAIQAELRDAHDKQWAVDIPTAATIILCEELGTRATELRRLSEYERRALSARRKALRCLDYERVEAERRRVAMEVAGRRGAPRSGVA